MMRLDEIRTRREMAKRCDACLLTSGMTWHVHQVNPVPSPQSGQSADESVGPNGDDDTRGSQGGQLGVGGAAAQKQPATPVKPPGYVPDMRCFFCGLPLPFCKIRLWLKMTAPREQASPEGCTAPSAAPSPAPTPGYDVASTPEQKDFDDARET